MVKKKQFCLFVLYIVIVALCGLLLLFCFDYDLEKLTEQIFISVFTGCIFALPGVVVVEYWESKKTTQKLIQLCKDLEAKIVALPIGKSTNTFNSIDWEEAKKKILQYYYGILYYENRNYTFLAGDIDVLGKNLFLLLDGISILNGLDDSVDNMLFVEKRSEVIRTKDVCIASIKKIKKS